MLAPTFNPSQTIFVGPFSALFSSSTKLTAAQSGIQACDTHLAAKERELAIKRCIAIRDGLGAHIRAFMECGWVWSGVGKEALRVLETEFPGKSPVLFIHRNGL
jgi:hypothetical protein